MKKKLEKKLFAVSSLISMVTQGQASAQTFLPDQVNFETNSNSYAHSTFKLTLGFDPKYAINTLYSLVDSGVETFEDDGSVFIDETSLQRILENASAEDLKVIINHSENDGLINISFRQNQPKFDWLNDSEVEALKSVMIQLTSPCDMD